MRKRLFALAVLLVLCCLCCVGAAAADITIEYGEVTEYNGTMSVPVTVKNNTSDSLSSVNIAAIACDADSGQFIGLNQLDPVTLNPSGTITRTAQIALGPFTGSVRWKAFASDSAWKPLTNAITGTFRVSDGEEELNYALVERISVEGTGTNVIFRYLNNFGYPTWGPVTSWDGNRVRLLLSDGTERNFNLDEAKRYRTLFTNADTILPDATYGFGVTDIDSIKEIYDAGQVVRFTENSDGTVRLSPVGALPGTAGTIQTANTINNGFPGTPLSYVQPFSINNHLIRSLFRENDNGTITEVGADSDTVFVIKTPDGIKAYTGLQNAPDVNETPFSSVTAYAYISTDAYNPTAKLVYVLAGSVDDMADDFS